MEELRKLGNRAASRSPYFGIIDLCCIPKDQFYLYQSCWRSDKPMAHILHHWNWPERVGKITPVHVYTSGPLDLIGVCNDDPGDHTAMKPAAPSKAAIKVFNGLAQVVVRSRCGEPGSGTIGIRSETAGSTSVRLIAR